MQRWGWGLAFERIDKIIQLFDRLQRDTVSHEVPTGRTIACQQD